MLDHLVPVLARGPGDGVGDHDHLIGAVDRIEDQVGDGDVQRDAGHHDRGDPAVAEQ